MEDRYYVLEKLAGAKTVGNLIETGGRVAAKSKLLEEVEAVFKTGDKAQISKLITDKSGAGASPTDKAFVRLLQNKMSGLTGVTGKADPSLAATAIHNLDLSKGSDAEKALTSFTSNLRKNVSEKVGPKLQPYVDAAKDGTLLKGKNDERFDTDILKNELGGTQAQYSEVQKAKVLEDATLDKKTAKKYITGAIKPIIEHKRDAGEARQIFNNLKKRVYAKAGAIQTGGAAPQVAATGTPATGAPAGAGPKVDAPEAGFNDEMKNAWDSYKKKWKEKPWAMGAGHAAGVGAVGFLATRGGSEQA